jgi:hypothetical protein
MRLAPLSLPQTAVFVMLLVLRRRVQGSAASRRTPSQGDSATLEPSARWREVETSGPPRQMQTAARHQAEPAQSAEALAAVAAAVRRYTCTSETMQTREQPCYS